MKNTYEIRGNTTAIFINHKVLGKVEVLISTSDLELVKEFPNTWFLSCNGHTNNHYAVGTLYTGKKQKGVKMHRLIMGVIDKKMNVDHINRNTFDNTRGNLRVVTSAKNAQNKKKLSNNTSGHTGIRWHKSSEKWQVSIQAEGEYIYLGTYSDLDTAILVRKEAEKLYWKE